MDQQTTCCIAGGGPAGLMLGVLLARAGVKVVVLEKHRDFLRDFRGDTIHPSTLQIMDELGWLDEFLRLPHQRVERLAAQFGEETLQLVDLSHLPVVAPYIAMMPQWDFLDFLAEKGRAYPSFRLLVQTEATGLIEQGGLVTGVRAKSPEGEGRISADLVVAADGRGSKLREAGGFKIEDFGAPMDVLWFRLPRLPTDTAETQARFDNGRIVVMLNRNEYWQCAFVIPKGEDAHVRAAGLPAFRASVANVVPFEAARADALQDWDQVKLLTVKVDRLAQWALPGMLCIGDAAHAMSPVGGVGVNLAVQDAVATANLLAKPLRDKRLTLNDLKAVQARRSWPTRVIQRMQVLVQNSVISPRLNKNAKPVSPPLALRIITRVPWLKELPGRMIGLGVRREHVKEFIRSGRG